MIFGIARFEIRYQLRNPVFWIAAFIFFLMGYGLTASANVSLGTPGGVHQNGANAIAVSTVIFSLFYVFVITAFVANAIIRDDASGFAPIVRATAVTRHQILAGRFIGGLIIAWLGYVALPVGMLVGSLMPWVDPESLGPQTFSFYAWPFLILAVPNIFLLCAVLFALATLLRSMMAAYIAAIVLVMGYFITSSLLGPKIEYRDAVARWEPLGTGAVEDITRYWTQSELNSRLIDLSGLLLFNRLYATVLGLAFLALTFWRFSLSEPSPSRRRLRRLAKRHARQSELATTPARVGGERVTARDAQTSRAAQFLARLRIEVRQVLTNPGLIVLGLLAVGFTSITLWLSGSRYGTSDHPTVAATIEQVQGGSGLFLLMIAAFFGGELVWRERDRKVNELIDSSAVPGWVMTVPKILAIFIVLLIVDLVAALTGVVYQLTEGARSFGLIDYLAWFIVPAAIDGLLIAVLAVFVQVLSPNKYLGWGILFAWFVSRIFLKNVGYGSPLYNYSGHPLAPLSDFVGVGRFWQSTAVFQFYWLCFATVLAVFAHLMWPRGTDLSVRRRLGRIRTLTRGPALTIAGVATALMIFAGGFGYYNIKVLNRYQTQEDTEKLQVEYERKYLRYENLPMPSVTRVTLNAQLYPRERRLITTGRYDLQNRTAETIRDVHVRTVNQDTKFLKMNVSGARLISNDMKLGYRIYRFDKQLLPGARATLAFTSELWRRGFRAGMPATDIIENGTFVNNTDFAPMVGMNRNVLLQDRAKRRRQGLTPDLRPAKLEDRRATNRNYVTSDWVMSDITLTTSSDQTPIAPGNQVSDAVRNGRRSARFVSPSPILNFFSLQSADYRVAWREHNGLKLSIYHHVGHDWNVPKMMRAMAAALDYYRSEFGPYQFNYARIIEFPGYNSFAQAFAGTMPYSESAGFNANTDDPDKIDFTTYIVAHEMSHQYWAHQVIGADMQGGTSLSETLAQYSALMVMKQLYGADKMRRFLKYELDSYLRNRAGEANEEMPLERVENQGYIHYNKGAVVMYLLQQRLGEDAVNRALSRFLAKWRFKGPPYPRSVDLVSEFRREAKTVEQQQLITDLFDEITLYDLRAVDAVTRKDANGWTTTLTISAGKFRAGGKGEETRVPLRESIEVGLFTARPGLGAFSRRNVIVMDLRPVRSGTQTVTIHTTTKPRFAGVDPYNFYIDRASDDNLREVTDR